MEKTTIHITGMACGGCSANIANILRAIDGVIEADVSHAAGTAEVSFDSAKVQIAQLKTAVETAGYKVQ